MSDLLRRLNTAVLYDSAGDGSVLPELAAARIRELEAQLAYRGEWPRAPKGVSASPPSYHKYPFKVEYCFGHGWALFKHGAACTLVAISDHDTPQAALTAMEEAYDAFAADLLGAAQQEQHA